MTLLVFTAVTVIVAFVLWLVLAERRPKDTLIRPSDLVVRHVTGTERVCAECGLRESDPIHNTRMQTDVATHPFQEPTDAAR